ncbi:glycosyl transferase [Ohtaekwangia sp.]|uniref:glycosyl transferase n=1 Tax=Ohtaekwangia sp. TaxID=2066019 RepID=UPI002FDD903E
MQTSIVFTLCSNNYLAHAKTLGDSLKKHNPDVHFIIGLVDERDPAIDYSYFAPYEVLPYSEIGYAFFSEMLAKYNVIEFNTAVKPFYFEYIFKQYGKNSMVYYIDPDIAFYSSLESLNESLKNKNIVITPHLTKAQLPVSPFETMVLNVGIYNLGFIGIRNTEESGNFLVWWQERLKDHCYIDYARGLFVDQIWINLVPLIFKDVEVLMNPGYNMACWNFHERKLLSKEGKYFVNEEHPLVFFHFSGFKPLNMQYVSKIKTREFTLEARPDLKDLFHEYAKWLLDNDYAKFSASKPKLKFGHGKYSKKQRIGLSLKFRTNSYIKKLFGV